jgi:hypothetical protein
MHSYAYNLYVTYIMLRGIFLKLRGNIFRGGRFKLVIHFSLHF